MKIKIGTLLARFYILKKKYWAYDGCIFWQVKFRFKHDLLEYIYVLSGLYREERKELYIKPEQVPEVMEISTAISFMQYTVGLVNLFNLFKEDIFLMLESQLEKPEFVHLRFVFLSI